MKTNKIFYIFASIGFISFLHSIPRLEAQDAPLALPAPSDLAPSEPAPSEPTPSKEPCRDHLARIGAKLDQLLASPKPLQLLPETEKKIQDVWTDSSLIRREKLQKTSDLLWQDREAQMNPFSAFFFRGALNSARAQNSVYNYTLGRLVSRMGAHYNPLFNRVNLPHQSGNDSLTETLVRGHELEHAAHRNTRPIEWFIGVKTRVFEITQFGLVRPLGTPLFLTWAEGQAIGSQWELMQKIPPETRKQYQKELKDYLDERLRQIHRPEAHEVEFFLYLVKNKIDLKLRGRTFKPMQTLRIIKNPAEHLQNGINVKTRPTSASKDDLKFNKTLLEQELKKWLSTRSPHQKEEIPDFITGAESDRAQELAAHFYASFPREEINASELVTLAIAVNSLKNAGLSKEEFVRKLQPIHGYTFEGIFKRHTINFDYLKAYLLLISIPGIYYGYMDKSISVEEMKEPAAIDVRLISRALALLFTQENTWKREEILGALGEDELWKKYFSEKKADHKIVFPDNLEMTLHNSVRENSKPPLDATDTIAQYRKAFPDEYKKLEAFVATDARAFANLADKIMIASSYINEHNYKLKYSEINNLTKALALGSIAQTYLIENKIQESK